MGKRPAASKSTRGISKAKANRIQSSSSNPTTKKFRSQVNSLTVIAKGGPSKKTHNDSSIKKYLKDAADRRKILDGLERIDMVEHGDANGERRTKNKLDHVPLDVQSIGTGGTKKTNASFASVWSHCSNNSLNDFFQVWDPKLESHKDALAVIAGLSQTMCETGTEQTDIEYTHFLFKLLATEETPREVLTGSLLALTFVMRKLSNEILNENFDKFYGVLKELIEKYSNSKRKTLVKCMLRCFAFLTKAHPMGKDAIESFIRKKINIAIRQYKIQNKIQL